MSDPRPAPEPRWEAGWDGHELAQLRRLARLSLAEKLDWLEQAQRVVLHLHQARNPLPTETRFAA